LCILLVHKLIKNKCFKNLINKNAEMKITALGY
jgi:hypothetical protein